MNWDKLKEAEGQLVRLRPTALQFDAEGNLFAEADDPWKILEVQIRKHIVVVNDITKHAIALRSDHIRTWMSPPANATGPEQHGKLQLTAQVVTVGEDVYLEPTISPGERLRNYTPRRRSTGGFHAALARMNNQIDAKARREAFEQDGSVVQASDLFFESIHHELRRLSNEAGFDLQLFPNGRSVLVIAFDVWATVAWSRKYFNSVKDAWLQVVTLSGPIQWPGVRRVFFNEGMPRSKLKFALGGDGPDSLCWIPAADDAEGEPLGAAGIAERILEEMIKSRDGPTGPQLFFV